MSKTAPCLQEHTACKSLKGATEQYIYFYCNFAKKEMERKEVYER